ncbi:hypothetical protein [Paracoccus actinidiae]|uniref:hypothetical protein n=1 Tax=Paracoccus actinidiae TaxID=3064531 RepID=UPI0027D28FDE|nr:hypothetical protein [Paracoccus sp. M09]
MDHNDRQAIEGLFGKLGQAAQAQPHRDPEAEALIGSVLARSSSPIPCPAPKDRHDAHPGECDIPELQR